MPGVTALSWRGRGRFWSLRSSNTRRSGERSSFPRLLATARRRMRITSPLQLPMERVPPAPSESLFGTPSFSPDKIDYLNAHGTSTDLNDKYETMAIKSVFGEHARKMSISSVKGTMGHALGAAGALETITCIKALANGIVPPTINYETPDPECDLDYTPNTARNVKMTTALNTNLGFGGHNACVILRMFSISSQLLNNLTRRAHMKSHLIHAASAISLLTLASCAPELARSNYGENEMMWEQYIQSSYKGWRPPPPPPPLAQTPTIEVEQPVPSSEIAPPPADSQDIAPADVRAPSFGRWSEGRRERSCVTCRENL